MDFSNEQPDLDVFSIILDPSQEALKAACVTKMTSSKTIGFETVLVEGSVGMSHDGNHRRESSAELSNKENHCFRAR